MSSDWICAFSLFWISKGYYLVGVHECVEDAGAQVFDLVLCGRQLPLQVGYVLLQQLHVYLASLAAVLGSLVVTGAGRVVFWREGPVCFGESGDLGSQLTHPRTVLVLLRRLLAGTALLWAQPAVGGGAVGGLDGGWLSIGLAMCSHRL